MKNDESFTGADVYGAVVILAWKWKLVVAVIAFVWEKV